MNNILVTGANGFIGNKLCETLKDRNYLVTEAVKRGLASNEEKTSRRFVGNIDENTNWSKYLDGIDCIIHCAARTHIMKENTKNLLSQYREINVKGTCNLAEQAVIAGVKKFIFISSIKVNGEKTVGTNFFKHNDYPKPEDPYAISKWEAEKKLFEISKKTGLEVVIIRPPLVLGPRLKGNLLKLIKLISYRIPLPFLNIKNSRSFIGLNNLVNFIILCIKSPAASGEIFLVKDSQDLSTPKLIKKISNAMGKFQILLPMPVFILKIIFFLIGRSSEFDRLFGSLRIDCSHAYDVLGWKPTSDINASILETANWFLKKDNDKNI